MRPAKVLVLVSFSLTIIGGSIAACGRDSSTTATATSASSTGSGAGGFGGVGGGSGGMGGQTPIDAMKALEICQAMCDVAVGLGCAVADSCQNEECPQFIFDARNECLDEFAALWECRKEFYETDGQCHLYCNALVDPVFACLEQYGCWRAMDASPCDFQADAGPNGEDVCNCRETCEQVALEMKCLRGTNQTDCDCYADGSYVGSCTLNKALCTYRAENTCCNQFYGL